MPQMVPMSWTILFILFSLMLIMINTLYYYLFNPKISSQEKNKENKNYNKVLKVMTNLFSVFDPSTSMFSLPMN